MVVTRKLLGQYKRLEAACDAANRATAARDELLAIVSYGLRTPLSTVVVGASLLKETASGSMVRHATSVVNGAERMQHLIDGLLERARLDAGTIALERRDHEFGGVCTTAAELFRERAHDRRAALEIDASPGHVYGDRERLLQILSNLIGNALKFARPDDTVTIRAESRANETYFGVVDTGPGIPPEHVPRLFDRYFQGKRAGETWKSRPRALHQQAARRSTRRSERCRHQARAGNHVLVHDPESRAGVTGRLRISVAPDLLFNRSWPSMQQTLVETRRRSLIVA